LLIFSFLTCLSFLPSPSHHITADHNAAPDPELERKLREMEANQINAWEEKEKLSQALEAERQANMNNVISEMMNGVKEQKVRVVLCWVIFVLLAGLIVIRLRLEVPWSTVGFIPLSSP